MRNKVPVYEEVKQQIKARIESGEWASGERVPSEYELVNALGIGRHRARQALRELEIEGYIVRRQGSGSYVVPASDRTATVRVAGKDAVAMFFPRYTCRYSRQLVDGFMRHMASTGRRIIMYNVSSDERSERESLRAIVDSGVEGFVAWIDYDTPEVRRFLTTLGERRFPVVLADRYLDGVELDSVVSLNEDIGYRLTRALIEAGHRRIAYAGYKENVSSIVERYKGYQRALRDADLAGGRPPEGSAADRALVLNLERVHDEPERVVKETMSLRNRPTAFVCTNDLYVSKVYAELLKLGYRAPDNIEFAAVDDEHPVRGPRAPMTRIAQNAYEVGAQSAALLLARVMEPDRPVEHRTIQAGPVVRDEGTDVKQT